MAHHQMLTFPILAAAEIVECMDELAIPVTLADLAKVRARGAAQRERMGAYLGRISKKAVGKGVILRGTERERRSRAWHRRRAGLLLRRRTWALE